MSGSAQGKGEQLAELRTRMRELRDEFRAIVDDYHAGRLTLTEEVALLTALNRDASAVASQAAELIRQLTLSGRSE